MKADEAAPAQIGRYEIRRELGRGTMGIVYEGFDPLLGRAVALKTIQLAFTITPDDRRSFEERFFAEARAAARLSHLGIVVVYDVGVDPATGALFMALEHLQGETLEAAIGDGKPLEWRRALHVVRRVAEALHHAHESGIIHRDVKPANIMLLPNGEPKIMDFGLAKLPAAHLTRQGQLIGSPSYMSPERSATDGQVDARSDIFSLGAVLYEALTGQKAFSGPNVAAILTRVAYEEPVPMSRIRPGLPPGLEGVVAHALAKRPEDRYPDALTMADDLFDIGAGALPRSLPTAGLPTPPLEPQTMAGSGSHPGLGARIGDETDRHSRTGLVLPTQHRVGIIILSGDRQGEVIRLDKPELLIGRAGGGAGVALEIPDPRVSRVHAVVECYGNRIVVRDLGSKNGTFVGDKRIDEHQLEDRTEFRLGGTRFLLTLSEAE